MCRIAPLQHRADVTFKGLEARYQPLLICSFGRKGTQCTYSTESRLKSCKPLYKLTPLFCEHVCSYPASFFYIHFPALLLSMRLRFLCPFFFLNFIPYLSVLF
jgi:hypothetical protein